jgi:hypothetical protein
MNPTDEDYRDAHAEDAELDHATVCRLAGEERAVCLERPCEGDEEL